MPDFKFIYIEKKNLNVNEKELINNNSKALTIQNHINNKFFIVCQFFNKKNKHFFLQKKKQKKFNNKIQN